MKKQKGVSIIEVVIASAIISVFIITVSSVYTSLMQLSFANINKTQAIFLLDEGLESLKVMRSYSWSTIASSTPNTDYYLIWQNNRWQATTTKVIIDGTFTRKFKVRDVYRDVNTLNIVYTGGVSDINSKIIDLQVSWNDRDATNTKEISFYIFNLYE